jgi:hypothetical protein
MELIRRQKDKTYEHSALRLKSGISVAEATIEINTFTGEYRRSMFKACETNVPD